MDLAAVREQLAGAIPQVSVEAPEEEPLDEGDSWAVEEDPRCYLSAMPPHVCDMAQHWNQYECFSLWQQGTLGRDEQCTLQFNSTRAHINIRIPLEEIYYKLVVPDPLLPEETVRVPFDPPVFLRTLAPADWALAAAAGSGGGLA